MWYYQGGFLIVYSFSWNSMVYDTRPGNVNIVKRCSSIQHSFSTRSVVFVTHSCVLHLVTLAKVWVASYILLSIRSNQNRL